MQHGITIFIHMLKICGLLWLLLQKNYHKIGNKIISYQKDLLTPLSLLFHPATCGQPDIPPNALLTYKKGIIRGNIFLEDSEVLFVYSTSDGKAYLHSFCQNGNWTEPIPINGINNRLFNHHSLQATICKVSDNHIKIIV